MMDRMANMYNLYLCAFGSALLTRLSRKLSNTMSVQLTHNGERFDCIVINFSLGDLGPLCSGIHLVYNKMAAHSRY